MMFDGEAPRVLMPDPIGVPMELEQIVQQIYGEGRSGAVLRNLRKSRTELYPLAGISQNELLRSLKIMDWQSVHPSILEKAVESLPNIQLGIAGRTAMDNCWPWWLAAHMQESHKKRRVLVEPEPPHEGSCDLFSASDDEDRALSPSKLRYRQEFGVAIECKALEEIPKIEDALSKAKKQLKKYGSGIVAMDVSRPIREECQRHPNDSFQQTYARCAELQQIMFDRTKRYSARDAEFRQVVQGVAIHCRVISSRRDSSLVEGGYIVYEYARALGFGTYTDLVFIHPQARELIESTMRICPRICYYPPVGMAFVTRANAILTVRINQRANDFSIGLTPSSPDASLGPEIPVTALQTVAKGSPDQHSQRIYTLVFERFDKPHPEDMRVSVMEE